MRVIFFAIALVGVRSASRLALAVAALATLGLLAGCGSGSGHSGANSGGSGESHGTVSDLVVIDLGDGSFQVEFTLSSDTEEDLGIDLDFSENLGLTFGDATMEAPDEGGASGAATESTAFAGTPEGVGHHVFWVAPSDLSSLRQHDLVLRVTPYDLDNRGRGAGAVSEVFGIGLNTPPGAVVGTPAGTVGGQFAFDCTISDDESDFVGVEAEYSLDGGSTFAVATLVWGGGPEALATTPGGTGHVVRWDAQGDVPDRLARKARFRIRALDTDAGDWSTTGSFFLHTYAPTIDLLTVNRIPAAMNGSAPYTNNVGQSVPFSLLLPESGFIIWLEFSGHPSGAAIDPAGIELTSAQPIGGGRAAGGHDAGEDFGGLATVDTTDGTASFEVPPSLAFASGAHTITARVRDVLGNVSAAMTNHFETSAPTAARRPFEATDTWYLDFGRDNFTITGSTSASGTVTIMSLLAPNGIADFVEDLRVLGLNSASPPRKAIDAGLNDVVVELVKGAVVDRLDSLFGRSFDGAANGDSVNIEFVLEPPPGDASRIGIGGDDPIPGFTIGRAEFDYRNSRTNDDTDIDLGVFSTNLIDFYINSSFTFKLRFDPLIPGRGTPVGFHAADVTVLAAGFDRLDPANSATENGRYDEIMDAVDAISRSLAAILGHEIGHSVGLVANGGPSSGLFGGEAFASFAGPYTTSFHLDTAGNNIMAAAISFSGSIQTGSNTPHFNEMNLAYLLERVLLD